jgi:5-carboxymethyl-2-hydroxymuconate isomerase
MPHFIAECTDNIREQADLPGLFAKVNEALAATGIFPLGGIRSRAHWLDTWQMADGKHDYAFVHMTLKIGAGRSLESRRRGRNAVCADQNAFRGADGEPLSGAVV